MSLIQTKVIPPKSPFIPPIFGAFLGVGMNMPPPTKTEQFYTFGERGYEGEGPFGSGQDERLRHHAEQRNHMRSQRQRGNETRLQASTAAYTDSDEISEWQLLAHLVKPVTSTKHYLPAVVGFCEFCHRLQLPFASTDLRDRALTKYLNYMCYVCNKSPQAGAYLMSGYAYVCPEESSIMHRAWKTLKAWQRGHVGGEGSPETEESMGCLMQAMDLLGYTEEADALRLALDSYLRTAELFALCAEDIVVDASKTGVPDVALRLGVVERNESTKTGVRQGVRLDWPGTVDIVIKRAGNRSGGTKLFNTDAPSYRRAWKDAEALVQTWRGCESFRVGPPHSVRHTGASRDAAAAYRSLWQIQRRGRWSSEKSVMRYAKTHAWTSAQARLPDAARVFGAAALLYRGQRAHIASE
jgi:hypothetical protein